MKLNSNDNVSIDIIYNNYKNIENIKNISSQFFIEGIQKIKDFYFEFPDIFKDRFYCEGKERNIDEKVYKELDDSVSLRFVEIYNENKKQIVLVEWVDKPCALFIFKDNSIEQYYITDDYRFTKICQFINLLDSQYITEKNPKWKNHLTRKDKNIFI